MRRLLHCTILVMLLSAVAPAAWALNPLFVSVKAGESSLSADLANGLGSSFDDEDGNFGAGLGLSLGKYIVFQGEYQDLGTVSAAAGVPCSIDPEVLCTGEFPGLVADSTAVSVSFLPHVPLSKRVWLYGKLGYASWDSEIRTADTGAVLGNVEREDGLYGGGVRLYFPGPLALFAEYENIGDIFETVSVGATLGF